MKAFRGALVALLLFALAVGAWYVLKPQELTPKERKALREKEQGVALFTFEKADLVKVEITRPDGPIVLSEKGDTWWIEGQNLRASRNMVNRVKHQIHDLVARATVVDNPEDPALYGLGPSAIHVKLTMRDGSIKEFDAGDPNPSGVSFYIRPTGGTAIYTVKKSAVDYYSLSGEEFRERRFASFDSKDVDGLEATLPDGSLIKFQRSGERNWDMLAPKQIPAADDEVRALMGRVSAIKAIKFAADAAPDLSVYGLDKPRLSVTLRFSGREPLTLLVGKATGEKDGEYNLAYAKLADEAPVYAVRDGLIEDYQQDPETWRLKRFARIDPNDLTTMSATFTPVKEDDKDLAGTVLVKQAADRWQWDDGVLVPGSTPRRLSSRAANISADAFVAEQSDDTKYGFDTPIVKIAMTAKDGTVRTIVVGKPADPVNDPDGNPRDRWYARALEFPEVYIIDDGLVDVVKDLMREHGRHARGEEDKEERQERIEKERKPGPPRPGEPPR